MEMQLFPLLAPTYLLMRTHFFDVSTQGAYLYE